MSELSAYRTTYVVSAFPPPLVAPRELRRAGRRTVAVRLKPDTTYESAEKRYDPRFMPTPVDIAPARGKLGVLLVGLGAVSTTTIAGVLAVRNGFAKPIGSLTQMGTVRLGKRTEGRSPKISDVVPLSSLDDLVFGGWDIFEDDCYAAARTAGVIEPALHDQVRPELEKIRPWPAVFDQR